MRTLIVPAAMALLLLSLIASGVTLAALEVGSGGLPSISHQVELNIQDDVCEHDFFIFGSNDHNLELDIFEPEPGLIRIEGDKPWIPLDGFSEGGKVFAQGEGVVAGFANTVVTFSGFIDEAIIGGKVTYGESLDPPGQGGLPGCEDDSDGNPETPQPAIYEVKPKPETPTPDITATPTEEEKAYSIIVLKLDSDNNNPLEGFEFNLYEGNDCQGIPISTQETGDSGLLDFTGLEPGKYSIEEKEQPGWNVVGEECQDVQVPGGGIAGLPPCPVQPNADFPQPGCDEFVSGARVIVEINGTEEEFPVTLNGPTQIARLTKPQKDPGLGLDVIETEIVFMSLIGSSPLGEVTVVESDAVESRGRIIEQQNSGAGKMNFPANSFFDVFFEVEIADLGITLHNQEPFRVECKIEEIPPILCFYQPPVTDPIDLVNDDKVKIAKITHAMHIPLPPKEVLVVFENEQKATPTPTPAGPSVTNTPTATPTSGTGPTVTPTHTPTPGGSLPTATPTRTSTPVPGGGGDVNKDGTVNAIDAALVLQAVAGLTTLQHPDNADVNLSNTINAIDATLILQKVAGLIPSLPV